MVLASAGHHVPDISALIQMNSNAKPTYLIIHGDDMSDELNNELDSNNAKF